jgi:glucose-6-phosphate isomerase
MVDILSLKFEYYPKINDDLLRESVDMINNNKGKWDSPFFTDTKSYLDLDKIRQTAEPYLNDNIENIIVLGTGGSIQTLMALKHLAKKKVFPVPSSRAVELKGCLDKTSPQNSVVIPISRGGETLDVNSTIGIFLKRGYKFLGLSSKGTMFEMLKRIDCPILGVPDLSGRFAGSISGVGIVPAILSGIDVNRFLEGLDQGYKTFMNDERNPSLELSSYLYNLYEKRYRVVFSMPYSKNLEGVIGLLVQEISESSGKDGEGLMGAYQSAPLCQHSVLEYLLGGFKGAVVPILWVVENEMPDIILDSSIDYVNGQSAQGIINYQADATFQALIEQGIPSAKISIENPSEFNIGYLISFIQSTIYKLCLLLDVNWANNPKVVIGKKICNEALRSRTPSAQREQTRRSIAEEKFRNFY